MHVSQIKAAAHPANGDTNRPARSIPDDNPMRPAILAERRCQREAKDVPMKLGGRQSPTFLITYPDPRVIALSL